MATCELVQEELTGYPLSRNEYAIGEQILISRLSDVEQMDFSVVEIELYDALDILAGFCRRIISTAKWAVSTP